MPGPIAMLLLLASIAAADDVDRTVLPIVAPRRAPITVLDARDAVPPTRATVAAPPDAPNVLLVVLDGVGFGEPSTFGGPVAMPTLDRLAREGLRYTALHTAGATATTHAALLTGRDPHTVDVVPDPRLATAFHTGELPPDAATLATILRHDGWATAAFGQWVLTPPWEVTPNGPFDRWPTRLGFGHFFGFLGVATDPTSPILVDDTRVVEPSARPRELTSELADQAIAWVRAHRAARPDTPFLLWLALPAGTPPQRAPDAVIERYTGAFDAGWDEVRRRTLRRQRQLSVVPRGTRVAPKPDAIVDWDVLSADEQALFARQMEVRAGALSHADDEVGRLVDALRELDVLDDTLVIVLAGTGGVSAEGGLHGTTDLWAVRAGADEPLEAQLRRMPELGGPRAWDTVAAGWAVAAATPFAQPHGLAGFGGTRAGLVVRWPGAEQRGVRPQVEHVVDVVPTILDVLDLPIPTSVDGVVQAPLEGASFRGTFASSRVASKHTTQVWEIDGNRAILDDGWLAEAVHRAPWDVLPRSRLADDVWALYDTRSDPSLTTDLAGDEPDRLRALQQRFQDEALRVGALPLDDRPERVDAALVGRPDPAADRTRVTLDASDVGLTDAAFLPIAGRSMTITATIRTPAAVAEGAIVAQGGRFGGWALYADRGRPAFDWHPAGAARTTLVAPDAPPPGRHVIACHLDATTGVVVLTVDGARVADGLVDRGDELATGETVDVGTDLGTPVAAAYAARPRFTGRVDEVTIETEPPSDATASR